MEEIAIIGDWKRDTILGRGSFGTVILWKKHKTGEEIATKICRWGDDPMLKQKHKDRWSKEVEMLSQIDCPNIVKALPLPEEFFKTLNAYSISKMPILCMEFCSGGDLRKVLNNPNSCCGLPEIQIRYILRDVKNAISYLHSLGITHRDLKPENIVLAHSDNLSSVPGASKEFNITYKLIDLGYAKELDYNSQCASFVGTLQYLAPELLSSKTYSNSVDFWSFGLVAFEIICGIRPFLPNSSAMQWMQYAKDKDSFTICIFENLSGTPQVSRELFKENHISFAFKRLLEKWLRVALEWNPKKRGYISEAKTVSFILPNSENGEVVIKSSKNESPIIFSMLSEVLSQQILVIFSVYTFSMRSYSISESDTIATVQNWIEKDLQVDVEDQLLIPRNCAVIKPEDLAGKYWNANPQIMIFLFHKNRLMKDSLDPKIPYNIEKFLGDTNLECNFNNMADLYRNMYHFVLSEKELFEQLALALFVIVEYLSNKCKQLLLMQNNVDKEIVSINAKKSILAEILEYDERQWKSIDSDIKSDILTEYKNWTASTNSTLKNINMLLETWTHLNGRLSSISRRTQELNSEEIHRNEISLSNNAFDSLKKEALAVFATFKKNEKELRGTKLKCRDALKIAYKCLKIRDKLLQTLVLRPFIQKIFDVILETQKIAAIINKIPSNVNILSKELSNVILEKHQSHWQLMLNSLKSVNFMESDIPYTVMSFEQTPSIANFRIGDAVSSSQPHFNENGFPNGCDLTSLIQESIQLRNIPNQISSLYAMCKEISESMDFDYLDE